MKKILFLLALCIITINVISQNKKFTNVTISGTIYSGGRDTLTDKRFSLSDIYSNTIIGLYSGLKITTGSNNTALGYKSGYSNTTGTGNIFLGYTAGNYLVSSSNQLFIHNNLGITDSTTAKTHSLMYGQMNATVASQQLTINAVLLLPPLSSAPFSGTEVEGMIYLGTDHHIYYWNGTIWKQLDN